MDTKINLKTLVSQGIKWQVGVSFLQKIISFVTTIIIARILGPSNYGLFALAFVVIGAFGLFKSLGFELALIQRKNEIEKAADTAFFIIPSLGFLLYAVLFFSAPLIAHYLNSNELIGVLRVLGIIFVLWSFSRVPLSLLEKEMKFNLVSISEISGTIFFSVTAILLAKKGFGVWSLVYGYLMSTVIFVFMIWFLSGWRPNFNFNMKIAAELFNFGKFIFLGNVIWFLKMNLDNVLVGKFLGISMLGLYAVAFNISNFISDYFGGKVYRVTYPAYSRLQNNENEMKSAYLKVIKHIAMIAVPFTFGVFMLGDGFLKFAYGEKWLGAGQVLKILTLGGLFNTLATCNEAILLSQGKSKICFWVYSIQVVTFFIFIKPAAHSLGLQGVGAVVAGASCLATLFSFFYISKLLSLKFWQAFDSTKTSLICSFLMCAVIIPLNYVISIYFNALSFRINFIVLFSCFLFGYVFLTHRIDPQFFKETKKIIFS
jgi:O-antigen/teichoic acid export membrane protein